MLMEVIVPRYAIARTMALVTRCLASVHVVLDILGTNVRRLVIKATTGWIVSTSVPVLVPMLKVVIQKLADAYANQALEVSVVSLNALADSMGNRVQRNVIVRTMDRVTFKRENAYASEGGMVLTATHPADLPNME